MKFCSNCGRPVMLRVPDGDSHERYICDNCGMIHYANPRMVVGTISLWRDKILLCRRAIEPRRGWWTLPAGFMELGESTSQGALRETLEEAGAHITVGELFAVVDVPHVQHAYLFFLAALDDARVAPGSESLEAGLFAEAEIPWSRIAFPAVAWTLHRFIEDRAAGRIAAADFRVHALDIDASYDLSQPKLPRSENSPVAEKLSGNH